MHCVLHEHPVQGGYLRLCVGRLIMMLSMLLVRLDAVQEQQMHVQQGSCESFSGGHS